MPVGDIGARLQVTSVRARSIEPGRRCTGRWSGAAFIYAHFAGQTDPELMGEGGIAAGQLGRFIDGDDKSAGRPLSNNGMACLP